jgi:hypothetical protein
MSLSPRRKKTVFPPVVEMNACFPTHRLRMNLHIACVSENTESWASKVEDLAASIRRLRTPLGEAPITANFVSGVEPEFEQALLELGVSVRVVDPMPGDLGPANKLRMLELGAGAGYDTLVALDCDVVVVDDFTALVPEESIGLKPADDDRFKARDWRKLCEIAGLDGSRSTYRATSNGKEIPPYYNSGVMTVPAELCDVLRRQWTESYRWLMERIAVDPHLLPKNLHWFADQISLTLAIEAACLPVTPLPVGMNMPTHSPVHRSSLSAGFEPYILHYHGEIDEDGFLLRPDSGLAATEVGELNRARAERLSVAYRGLRSRSRRHRLRMEIRRRRRKLRFRRHRFWTWLRDTRARGERAAMPLADGGHLARAPAASDRHRG